MISDSVVVLRLDNIESELFGGGRQIEKSIVVLLVLYRNYVLPFSHRGNIKCNDKELFYKRKFYYLKVPFTTCHWHTYDACRGPFNLYPLSICLTNT